MRNLIWSLVRNRVELAITARLVAFYKSLVEKKQILPNTDGPSHSDSHYNHAAQTRLCNERANLAPRISSQPRPRSHARERG